MNRSLTYILLLIVVTIMGCKPAVNGVEDPKPAVYYWRTTLTLDSVERQFLHDHNVGKMYVRYFDITLND